MLYFELYNLKDILIILPFERRGFCTGQDLGHRH